MSENSGSKSFIDGDQKEWLRSDFINSENKCTLCQSELAVSFQFDEMTEQLHEEATCETCGIKTRNRVHEIH